MKKIIAFVAVSSMLAACGTVGNSVISDKNLQQKSSIALNTNPENIRISNRRSDGLDSVRFTATANGRSHQCYITTVMGAISSDAVCSAGNGNQSTSSVKATNQQCNALLKAAGRC